MVAVDNPAQLQLCRVNLERIKVLETKMKVEAAEQRVEADNKLRQDSVTSDVSSSDDEEELFNPGRLGWSDSPDLVTWRFADYPEEEDEVEEEEGSEEDYEEDWDVNCHQPAWLRISSEQLTSLQQQQQQEEFRSPFAGLQGSPHPGLRRSLSCVEISSPLTVKSFSRLETLSPSSSSNSPYPNRLSFHNMLNTSSLEDLSFVNESSNKEELMLNEEERIRGEGECCSCRLNQGSQEEPGGANLILS